MKFKKIIIFLLFLLGIFICYVIRDLPHLLIYDQEKNIVYDVNNTETIVENIVNPVIIRENIVVGGIIGNEPYIGYFDLQKKENKVIIKLNDLEKMLAEEISLEDIYNIQCIGGEGGDFSFVIDNKLYKYNKNIGIEEVWEFTGKIHPKPYCWLNDDSIILLDEPDFIDDWRLLLISTKTNQVTLIDSDVSAFSVADEIIYSKKYYMGSWCEWELNFVNQDLQKTKDSLRSMNWSVGDIVVGDNNKLFFLSSTSGMLNKEAVIYQLNYGFVPVRKICNIPSGDKLIGIME